MPGFVIHLAVAKEYMQKHKDEIKNEEEFMRGILEPDLISDLNKNISKGKTHYGKNGVRKIKSYLDLFLAEFRRRARVFKWRKSSRFYRRSY